MTTNKDSGLSCIEIDPSHGAAQCSMIWLHGLGADGNDFVSLVPELNLPSSIAMRFIFPHAPIMPVTINQGYEMRAWFDIYGLSFQEKIDEEGIHFSVTKIEKLIAQEVERGIPANKIFLGGFSQGSVIALATGLLHEKSLAGILGLSGFFPLTDDLREQTSLANKQIPIFLAHGTQDNVVPFQLGQTTEMLLKKAGYPVTWKTYPIAHTVCKEEIDDISRWVQETLK